MDILLIRHGETIGESCFSVQKNRPDPKLSARGRAQADLLGRRLAASTVRRIYTSDLVRAVETAQIMNLHMGVPVEVRETLREIDMGRRSWEEVQASNPALYDAWQRHEWDIPYPGGECGGDAAKRAMAVINEITASGLDTVAVVTHGGIIRVLICEVLGIGQEKRFLLGPPENTSVSTIRYNVEKGKYSLLAMNDFCHLDNQFVDVPYGQSMIPPKS